jgi:hypothetical protein
MYVAQLKIQLAVGTEKTHEELQLGSHSVAAEIRTGTPPKRKSEELQF